MSREPDDRPPVLPWTAPLPASPKARRATRRLRAGVWVVLIGALIATVTQFQYKTAENLRKAADAQVGEDVKVHKGAIGRWRTAVREMWEGHNIYAESGPGEARLHPNMPFTVILLTPFAYLPVWAMALSFNVLKLLVLAAAVPMAVAVANHGRRRMPDWVPAIALAVAGALIIGDIQHGNTNVFVLGAVVAQLWLYRRGRDLAAGAALALAICLKMTPALFLLYWAYQRGWKVLAGAAAGLVVFAAGIPAAALGPTRYADLTKTWLDNLIVPGLVKGAWYPIHINQSLSGVVSRYFLDGPEGDIFWNPDDYPDYASYEHRAEWITLAPLSDGQAKGVLRVGQVAIVALMAWAIGPRRLGRDDGRRMLHYGLVVLGMMLLNQRTWDHHAGLIVLAALGAAHAVAFGRVSRAARAWSLGLLAAGGATIWLCRNDVVRGVARLAGQSSDTGRHWADVLAAYGPTFWAFVMLLASCVVLSVALRKAADPFAPERQRISAGQG